MGEWSISSPTGGSTASVNNGVVTVTENNTSTKHTYVVQYKDGEHCGEYTFYQEAGSGPGPGPSGSYKFYIRFQNKSGKNFNVWIDSSKNDNINIATSYLNITEEAGGVHHVVFGTPITTITPTCTECEHEYFTLNSGDWFPSTGYFEIDGQEALDCFNGSGSGCGGAAARGDTATELYFNNETNQVMLYAKDPDDCGHNSTRITVKPLVETNGKNKLIEKGGQYDLEITAYQS